MSETIPTSPARASDDSFRPADMLKDGLVAGLTGALVVAAAHGVADVVAGEPLRTPTTLGVLLGQGGAAARAVPEIEVAFRFTVLHMLVWAALGIAASALISWVDSRPRFASAAFAGFAFVFISASYVAGAFSVEGLPPLHLWVGTLLGSGSAAAYLAWRHPQLALHIEREHMTQTTLGEIERALALEASGCAALERAAERFPGSPAATIATGKRGHVMILARLADELGLEQPEDGSPAWSAEGLEDSLRAALAHEREMVDLYDRFLAVVPEMRIREAFVRLRYHSEDETIRKLEEALDTAT